MKNIYKFLTAQVLSATGDWFRTILLITTLTRINNNPSLTSVFFIMSILPAVLFTPIISPISQYFRKKDLLIFCDSMRLIISLLFIFAVYSENISIVLTLVFVNGFFAAISMPSKSAFLPIIVEEKDLVKANSMLATSQSVIMLISTALGGIAANFLSPAFVLSIDALSFLIAILLILSIKSNETVTKMEKSKKISYFEDLRNNFLVVAKKPILKYVIGYSAAREFIAGFVYVFFSYQILQILNLGSVGLSYGYIASGLGQISGAYLMNKVFKNKVNNQTFIKILFFSTLLLLITHAISYIISYSLLFFILNFVANLFYNPIGITNSVIITNNTNETNRGSVFFINHFFTMISYLSGFLVVGILFSVVNYSLVLIIVAVISLILIFIPKVFIPLERSNSNETY